MIMKVNREVENVMLNLNLKLLYTLLGWCVVDKNPLTFTVRSKMKDVLVVGNLYTEFYRFKRRKPLYFRRRLLGIKEKSKKTLV